LVPHIPRERLEVSFDETLPRFELKEFAHGSLEFLDCLLAFFPAGLRGDQLPRDEREPVGDDLFSRKEIKHKELLIGRVDFDRPVDVVAKRLFIVRQNILFLLQIVVDRRNLQRSEAIGLINLVDLASQVVEGLVPEKMMPAVSPVAHGSPYGKVFGYGSRIELQGFDDRTLGISLSLITLYLFEHRFVDHPTSRMVSSYLAGVLR